MLTLYLIYHPLERINLYHWYIYPLTESVTNLLNHSANFHPHLKLLATDYKTLRERERERDSPSWWYNPVSDIFPLGAFYSRSNAVTHTLMIY